MNRLRPVMFCLAWSLFLAIVIPAQGDASSWRLKQVYDNHSNFEQVNFIGCEDLNGDSRADVHFCEYQPDYERTTTLVHYSSDNKTFTKHRQFNRSGLWHSTKPVDVDFDGRPDLIFYRLRPDTIEVHAQAPDYGHESRLLFELEIPGLLARPQCAASMLAPVALPGDSDLLFIVNTTYGGLPRVILRYSPEAGVTWRRRVPSPSYLADMLDIDGDGELDLLFSSSSPANGASVDSLGNDSSSYEFTLGLDGEIKEWRRQGGIHSDTRQFVLRRDGRPMARITSTVNGAGEDRRTRIELRRLDTGEFRYLELPTHGRRPLLCDLDANGCDDFLIGLEDGRLLALDLDLAVIAERRFENAVYVSGTADMIGDARPEICIALSSQGLRIVDADFKDIYVLPFDDNPFGEENLSFSQFWFWEGSRAQPVLRGFRSILLCELEPCPIRLADWQIFVLGLIGGGILFWALHLLWDRLRARRIRDADWRLWLRLFDRLQALRDTGNRALIAALGDEADGNPPGTASSSPHLLDSCAVGLCHELASIADLFAAIGKSSALARRLRREVTLLQRKPRNITLGALPFSREFFDVGQAARRLDSALGELEGEVIRRFSCDLEEVGLRAIKMAFGFSPQEVLIKATINADPHRAVFCDQDCLYLLLENVMVNAREALAEHPAPEVHFLIRERNGYVELHVSDNGAGFSEKIREHFLAGSSAPLHGESGWGLQRSRLFLEQFGGDLELTSHAAELGGADLLLRFRLPREVFPPLAKSAEQTKAVGAP